VDTLNNRLVERVQAFVQNSDEPIEWAGPLLSPTPAPAAAERLAAQLAAAEKALVEIAVDVQALAVQVQKLAAQVAAVSADD
jgi:hypothetical protein